MASLILRRVILSVPVLLGITVLAFVLLASVPGDPVRALIEPQQLARMTNEQIETRRRELGLDGSPIVRYARWLGLDPFVAPLFGSAGVPGLLQGEFGYSIKTGRSIAEEVGPRIGPTLLLMGTSLALALIVGIPLGVISAVRRNTALDYVITTSAMLMISTPAFILGLILIYTLAVSLSLLPSGGLFTVSREFDVGDRVAHLVMPALVLGLANAAQFMRYTRAGLLEVLSNDYIVAARAKGLTGRTVLVRHGLRNALIPIITVVGIILPDLLAGAIITEQVFNWPGMGLLAVRAAADRDPSLIMAIVIIVGFAVLASNLLADIAYGVADPRIRHDSSI